MNSGRMLGLVLILSVPAVYAEKAVPVDSGSSSSSDSHAQSSSPSSSSGSSSSSSSGDHGSSASSSGHDSSSSSAESRRPSKSDGGSGANDRALTDAERRHPRPVDRGDLGRYGDDRGYGGDRGYGSGRYGSHYGSRGNHVLYGHYGGHYHGTIWYPTSCYYYDDYWYDGRYRYPRYYVYDPTGAVRVLVDPSETKVFVDGYYAGTSDDFDGLFQRLYLPPGRHEITLKLAGYKTHRVMVYSARGNTIKLHHDMVRGQGEDSEDLAGPMHEGDRVERAEPEADDDERDPREVRDPRDDREGREGPGARDPRDTGVGKAGLGTLRLSVNPHDASVYVDGQFWGTGIHEDLKLPAGRHGIAVVRPGFRNFEREVDVRPGDTTRLDVDLDRS